MMEFKKEVQDLVDQYEEQLAQMGITIQVSKRYFETEVEEKGNTGRSVILNSIERAVNRKKEKENGYNYQRNKYHCIVLAIRPVDKTLVRKEFCREYAFVLRKIERAYIGQAPAKIIYQENRVLKKIEKRIQKILQKAEKNAPQEVCKDTLRDVFRYATCIKYEYKTEFVGKDRYSWELILIGVFGGVMILFAFVLWLIYG